MNILIDTQVLVWLVSENSSLGPQSKKLLSDSANQINVSYFAFFELAIKSSIGKITYDKTIIDDIAKMDIKLVQAGLDALKKYQVFDKKNKDPFDNILIATALSEKLSLMTSDRNILGINASGVKFLDARR